MGRTCLGKALPLEIIIALVLIIAGCGPAPPSQKPAEPVARADGIFRLGVLGPFTGPSESTGKEFTGAATMALDAIDWRIGDYKIEAVWIDSQSDPNLAAQAYERAIVEDGIQAGVLNWHSSVAVECMDVAARYQIPHVFPFGASETINEKFQSDPEKYGYWMNKGWPTPAKLTTAYVQAVEDAIDEGTWQPAQKTFAICAEDTHWGRGFASALSEQLEAAGWTVVEEDYARLDQVDFYTTLNKLKSRGVALVAATMSLMPSFAAFINEVDEVGLDSLIIADGLGWAGEWYRMTGKSSNYVIDQIPGWATAEGRQFAEAFEHRWAVPPSASAAGLAYDGTNIFIEVARNALDEHGELTSETVYTWARENLQTGRWSYTDGVVMETYQYTPETLPDPVVGHGYYMFPVRQYFDGEGKIIYPPEWAEQKLVGEGAQPEAIR